MQNIGQAVLKNLWVAMPPVAEQQKILARVATETCPLDESISRLEREIRLLREYRTSLIADVVTGKLDVREAAARLPAEAGPVIEAEPTEESDDPEFIDEETEA